MGGKKGGGSSAPRADPSVTAAQKAATEEQRKLAEQQRAELERQKQERLAREAHEEEAKRRGMRGFGTLLTGGFTGYYDGKKELEAMSNTLPTQAALDRKAKLAADAKARAAAAAAAAAAARRPKAVKATWKESRGGGGDSADGRTSSRGRRGPAPGEGPRDGTYGGGSAGSSSGGPVGTARF